MSEDSGTSPPPAQRSRSTPNPFDKVNPDALGHLFPFLGQVGTDNLSSTSTTMLSRPLEALKSIYTQHVSQHPGDYTTAVRKITPALLENQAITETFRTLILLPFTEDGLNVKQLSEKDEVLQYLLWLIRYKVHPVHVAYGLYQDREYDQLNTVCAVFNDSAYKDQFKLAVALMNENAKDVYHQLETQMNRALDNDNTAVDQISGELVNFIRTCLTHTVEYANRKVHHISSFDRPVTCICYGKNTVWFKDNEHNYLSRVTVDKKDTIIRSARDVELGPFFDVQRPDTSIQRVENVHVHAAPPIDGIIQYEQVLQLGNKSRIVKCVRYSSNIVIVLTEDGEIYAHGGGQQGHILQEEGPFVDLLYDYSAVMVGGSITVAAFALSAQGIVYHISVTTDAPYENLKVTCRRCKYHPLVTQLAVLQTPEESEMESWGQITLHPEGSLYAHYENNNFPLTSNVTLIPHVIHDRWDEKEPYFFVVCKDAADETSELKRVTLNFLKDKTKIIWDRLYELTSDEHKTLTITAEIEDITLELKNPIVDKLNIDCIIEMVQDYDGRLFCLTSTGTVYQCTQSADNIYTCNIVEFPKTRIVRTFKTPTSESVATADDSTAAMSDISLRLRLRL